MKLSELLAIIVVVLSLMGSGFYAGKQFQEPIHYTLSVEPTPVEVSTATCAEVDYKRIGKELQRIIDLNDLRIVPIFGRQ